MADKFAPHVERLYAVAASPSRRLLAIGGARDLGKRAADAGAAGSSLHVLGLPKAKAEFSAPVPGAIHALCFAGDELLLAGLDTGAIMGWDPSSAADGKPPAVLLSPAGVHRGPVRALACDAMGTVLASVGDDGMLRIGRIEREGGVRIEMLAERQLCDRPLRAVAIESRGTPGQAGQIVAAAGDDGVIRSLPLTDVAGASMREMPCGEHGVSALCFPGDGRIAAGCGDGSLKLCYLEGAVDAENRSGDMAHAGAVRALVHGAELYDDARRPLPRRMMSIGEDGELKSWLLDTRRPPRSITLGRSDKGALHAMTLVPAGRGTKADRRGGTLVVVGQERRIFLVTIDEESAPSEAFERIDSRLAELEESLGASSVQPRIEAVTALGELAEDEARVLLDRALSSDRKPEVRQAAAAAIAAGKRRLSRPALRAALGDSEPAVRRAVSAALSEIERDAPLAAVRAALSSRYADIRTAAVTRLSGLRATSPLVPGLIAGALSDAAEEVRLAALEALYALDGPSSVEPVRVAMQRGPADIRRVALVRLGRAGKTADSLGRALLEAGLDDDDASVRETAFLVSVGTRARLAAALCVVDDRTRKALAELHKGGRLVAVPDNGDGGAGAASGGEPESQDTLGDSDLEPLFAALTCRHWDTALRATRSLALLGDSRSTGALLQLSREGNVEVRRAVVDALCVAAMAMPGDSRLSARLRWLLDDSDATVRTDAFDSLSLLGLPEGPPAELELAALALRSSQADIRLRALAVLVGFGGQGTHAGDAGDAGGERARRADELLGDALDDEDARVRGEAFNTLWAWHSRSPEVPLTRGARCRHADVRLRVVTELLHIKTRKPGDWADTTLLALIRDTAATVGSAAFTALCDSKSDQGRVEIYLAALTSPRAEVQAAGCKAVRKAHAAAVRERLITLVRDDEPTAHIAAIEAVDRLVPDDAEGFAAALASRYYGLRVRALELLGTRRDRRAVTPARELLSIPEGELNRPSNALRQRIARALADVGDHDSIDFYVELLADKEGVVREMGARGLASACRPGDEKPLAEALSHEDLAVRSWVAEGLARLGDARAVPVLAGTLRHDHQPIRLGAIMGFVALGPDGIGGILQGLEDQNREIQDLVFAVIVARDEALHRAGEPPDLLLSALSATSPELRFAAARILESRIAGEELGQLAQELVGPRKPDKAADMKDWPSEQERRARLGVLIGALASDHPAQRYAATQVLTLRGQALAFWRESARLIGPSAANRPRIPYTSWEDNEAFQPRKRGWVHSLFTRRDAPAAGSETERVLTVLKFAGAPEARTVPPEHTGLGNQDALRLAFGTYAGLVRQAPVRGESDETHRVRRDSIDRLAKLGASGAVGRDAVMPVLRRALSDPHHLVRRAAMSALPGLYEQGSLVPHRLALQASAADVGRAAVDAVIGAAMAGRAEASNLAREAVDAPVAEVRAYAMTQLPRLFGKDSLEPWFIALASRHADVRFAVVDRLVDSTDARVADALGRAMESDHEDLRLKAAGALARRGDARTVDVLSGILRSEDARTAHAALESLVALAHARPRDPGVAEVAAQAARAVAARLEDDPDRTADRNALIDALGRISSPAGGDALIALLGDDDAAIRQRAFAALTAIAGDRSKPARVARDGTRRAAYQDGLVLAYAREAASSPDVELRRAATRLMRDVDDRGAEELLARLVTDRDESVRVLAAETVAFRAEYVPGATVELLAAVLRGGRRELVLPAAEGLAGRRRPEAFQPLLLVFKAGAEEERERAVLALGTLGDRRALEDLEPMLDMRAERGAQAEAQAQAQAKIDPEDAALGPAIVEALARMLPSLADSEEHGAELTRVRGRVEHLAREGESMLRRRAITGLRWAGDERSRALIESIAGDKHEDDDVRGHAIIELGRLGNPASEAVLEGALFADDHSIRSAALAALRRIFPRERTRVGFLALRSPHDDISAPAASFLAQSGEPAVLLARLSEIDSAAVRQRLRRGLIRRGACPVAEIEALLTGAAAGPRTDAALIAGAVAPAAHRERLGRAAHTALAAAQSEYAAARAQIAGVSDDTGWQRLRAAEEAWRASMWACERLGAQAGAGARAAVSDTGAPVAVRREALRFIGRHGSEADAAAVEPSLSDVDASVRMVAAATLAALSPERARRALTSASVADVAAMAPVAEAALARAPELAGELFAAGAGRQILLPVVLGKKRTAEVAAVAAGAGAGKGKGPSKDKDDAAGDQARLTAIAALGRIGGAEAERALQAILDGASTDDDTARAAAYKAIRRLQRRAARDARYQPEVSVP